MSERQESRSPTARFLFWLAGAIFNHRALFFWPQLVLMVLCILYTYYNLDFLTSRNDLVGGEKQYHKIYLEFKKEFPVQDDLVVVVESEDMERNRQFIERLGRKLERDTNFASVFYKGDLTLMGPKALLFLSEEALRDLQRTLQDYRPFLVQFTKATNLVSLFNLVNTQFRTASREENAQNRALVKALPALERIIRQATDALMRPGTPPSPGVNALFEGGAEAERQMYITFANGRIFLLTTQATDEKHNADAVRRIRELITETQLEVPGLNVGLTGEPVLEVDEMAQSQRDSTIATIVALVIVAMVFIYGYHETGRPLKATACLLVGLSYTLAFTTAAVGHLNILTITFVPILIGLAVDFGVHLITRYEEELRRGRSQQAALEKAMVYTGMGIFTGAFTTAGAFFAMAAADFKGIREMGIICGGGMLVCLVPMMTLLPAWLLRGRQNVLDAQWGDKLGHRTAEEVDRRARLENVWLRRPYTVITMVGLLTALSLVSARRVYFDFNLLNMQSAGLPAVIFQDKLIQSSTRSVLFAAVVADSLPAATNLITQITNLPTVAAVESMARYLTEPQEKKLEMLTDIKALAAEIQFQRVDMEPADLRDLTQTLWSLHGYTGLAAAETRKEEPELHRQLVSLRRAISSLLQRMLLGERKQTAEKLGEFQQALFIDVRETFDSIQNQDNSGPLRVKDLPGPIRNRFVGVTGKHLLQAYPQENVWNRAEQEEFIRQIRQIDPRVTGTPVQLYEYTTLLKESFEQAAVYSLMAISILVYIHFRKVSAVVLSLLPVGVGFLWMLGLMGWLGIAFNPANVMTLPLIVGIGVTNGIHILNRFAEEQHPSILARSTGKAVLVSGLTTIAGFGSLMLAEHRGIRSLGFIMATGVSTCMLVGLTFLPAILNLLDKQGWTIKRTQRDNAQSTLGREEPR
ncbi:MAG: MMPL family transporter [Verrucomicrobia subdivision 3 bacterium]|nr:MMPL family transporter [Limisphaerales bacterium]